MIEMIKKVSKAMQKLFDVGDIKVKNNHFSTLLSFRMFNFRLNNSLLGFTFSLGIGLLFAHPSDAQEVINFGRSPSLNVLTSPTRDTSQFGFSPSNGVTCPTTSFSFGAFGAFGNDNSNDFTNDLSVGSDIDNFGVAAGISVPLGGRFSKYCKDYAKSLAEQQAAQKETFLRTQQITLLQQCHWLVVNRINTDQPAFEESGPFSSLRSCNDYDITPIQGGDNPAPPAGKILDNDNAPPTQDLPQVPANLILQQ